MVPLTHTSQHSNIMSIGSAVFAQLTRHPFAQHKAVAAWRSGNALVSIIDIPAKLNEATIFMLVRTNSRFSREPGLDSFLWIFFIHFNFLV